MAINTTILLIWNTIIKNLTIKRYIKITSVGATFTVPRNFVKHIFYCTKKGKIFTSINQAKRWNLVLYPLHANSFPGFWSQDRHYHAKFNHQIKADLSWGRHLKRYVLNEKLLFKPEAFNEFHLNSVLVRQVSTKADQKPEHFAL